VEDEHYEAPDPQATQELAVEAGVVPTAAVTVETV